MSIYDARLAALEKDVTVMKQDIIYKLDDTNSAVTMIQGVVGAQGRDLKFVINQIKGIDVRLAGSEIRLEGLIQDVGTIKEQQNVQGRDIKDIKGRLDGMDKHFTSLEEKFDQRFDQVMQVLATLTNKPSR